MSSEETMPSEEMLFPEAIAASNRDKSIFVPDKGFSLLLLDIGSTGKISDNTGKTSHEVSYRLLIRKGKYAEDAEDPGSWWEKCPPETQALYINNAHEKKRFVTDSARDFGSATFKHLSKNYPPKDGLYGMAIRSGYVDFTSLPKELEAATSSLLSRRNRFVRSIETTGL
jgi:hypothetical protein